MASAPATTRIDVVEVPYVNHLAQLSSGMYYSFNVRSFGAVGDGSADDTAAIQAAIAACEAAGGGEVFFPDGTYAISGPLRVSGSNTAYRGYGSATIIGRSDFVFVAASRNPFVDGVLNYYNVLTAANRGEQAISVSVSDAARFAAGNWVWVRARQLLTGTTTEPVAELNRVQSVDNRSGEITLQWPLSKDYSSDGTNIFGIAITSEVHENITFEHLKMVSPRSRCIQMINVYNCLVQNCRFEGASAIFTRGRNIICRGNQGHLTPGWAFTPLQRPYYFAVDTGSCNIVHENNVWSSAGTGIMHVHEGAANYTSRNNTYLQGESDDGATEDWSVISIRATSWNVTFDGETIINSARRWAMEIEGSTPYPTMGNKDLTLSGIKVFGKVVDKCCQIGAATNALVTGCSLLAKAAVSSMNSYASANILFVGNDFTGGPVSLFAGNRGVYNTGSNIKDICGEMSLERGVAVRGRNTADTTLYDLVRVGASDQVILGDVHTVAAYLASTNHTFSIGAAPTVDISANAFRLFDGVNINLGGTAGTKFGLTSSQKLAFYGATPVTRPTAITPRDGGTVDSSWGPSEASVLNNVRQRVDDIYAKLQALGLLS